MCYELGGPFVNVETKRRAPDPATRRPRPKKAFKIAEAKGADAARFPWTRAFRGAKVPMNAKAVGLVVASYGNADGSSNHPGLARLARDFDVDEKTIRRHLETLERAGWLRRTHDGRAGRSRKEADDYQLTIPQATGMPVADDEPPEEPPAWLDGEPDPDETSGQFCPPVPDVTTGQFTTDQWTKLSRHQVRPTKENHGVTSRGGVASATPNGSHSDHGIPADAVTATKGSSQQKPKQGKPRRQLSDRVSPEDRAKCNRYIGLLPQLDDDQIDEALTALWDGRKGLWVSAYQEMRKKFGGEPLPKSYSSNGVDYIEPDTAEQSRFMYEKALRFMSRDGGWHESLTDPLVLLTESEQSSEAPPWAA